MTFTATSMTTSSAETARRDRQPGRWIGGAIGAGIALVAAIVAGEFGKDGPQVLSLDWFVIGLLGIPIGFVLGRQLLPIARSGGWVRALLTGLALGLAAPPLGAIEILTVWAFAPTSGARSAPGLETMFLLPIAIPFSFVAAVMTVPAGIAWSIAVRLLGARRLEWLAAPAWLARFGARHAFTATLGTIIVVAVVRSATR